MSAPEEITAVYMGECFRFPNADGDVIVGDAHANGTINGPVKIKGPAEVDELKIRQAYRFYGRWTSYRNKRTGETEQQFHFETFVAAQPQNREAVIAYLRNAGEGHGFGLARATAVADLYGERAVQVFREQPLSVAVALGQRPKHLYLSVAAAEAIAETLCKQQALENCTIELTELLAGRGLPKTTARKAVQEWGNLAATVIRRDPYKLMRFRLCGFKRCDAFYLDLKLPPDRLKRQALCAWHALASNTEGHTWFPAQLAEQGIRQSVGGAKLRIAEALTLAERAGAIARLQTDGSRGPIAARGKVAWVAVGTKARNEGELARMVAVAAAEPCMWPSVASVPNISPHQQEQLAQALRGSLAILGGSPGTGKTFTAANVVRAIAHQFGLANIAIGAPTGKAAVRVTEALNAYGLPLRARTWHSLLGVESRADRGGWGFKHCEKDPLPFKVLIGDETSMNDTDLMASVFRARSVGCHVLLVGDVNQLPPVGHGAPLRDMIAAGLPYGELREIKRNSGGVVEACAAIRDGQRWQPGDNLSLVETRDADQQKAEMLRQLHAATAAGLDPIWDCQVLAAVNAKSPLSRKELNKVLQAELNSSGGQPGCIFRVGDKIVNTKNGYFKAIDAERGEDIQTNDQGDVYVANGELAQVLEVAEKYIVAKLSNPHRVVSIPRGKASQDSEADDLDGGSEQDRTATGCSWDLGYCLSTHKAQGSEFAWVIVMGDEYPGARMVCSREWLYTAISRAKSRCVLIGKQATFDAMARRVALGNRKTLLKERILLEQGRLELATL